MLHLDGVVALSLLDFYFKPAMMLGMEDLYGSSSLFEDCHSFKEFVKHISHSSTC